MSAPSSGPLKKDCSRERPRVFETGACKRSHTSCSQGGGVALEFDEAPWAASLKVVPSPAVEPTAREVMVFGAFAWCQVPSGHALPPTPSSPSGSSVTAAVADEEPGAQKGAVAPQSLVA